MDVIPGSLETIRTESISGEYYRYIRAKYANEPLSMAGSIQSGGRYNIAQKFGALYLGFDQETCQAEVSNGIAAGVPFKKGAFVAWQYYVKLQSVVRLDDENVLTSIGLRAEDITIPGSRWPASIIGEPLYDSGDIEGLVAPSAQLEDAKCLDIYLDRVSEDSKVDAIKRVGVWPE